MNAVAPDLLEVLAGPVAAYLARCERVGACLVNPNASRYGDLHYPGGRLSAHRAVWMVTNAAVIPPVLVVRHTCDVKACVEPTHLLSGTCAQNARDKRRQGFDRSCNVGTSNHTARITEVEVVAFRRAVRGGKTIRQVAADAGLKYSMVRYAVRGETWAHVTEEPPIPQIYTWSKPSARRTPSDYRPRALARVEAGWTLQQVADELGVSRDTAWHLTQPESASA